MYEEPFKLELSSDCWLDLSKHFSFNLEDLGDVVFKPPRGAYIYKGALYDFEHDALSISFPIPDEAKTYTRKAVRDWFSDNQGLIRSTLNIDTYYVFGENAQRWNGLELLTIENLEIKFRDQSGKQYTVTADISDHDDEDFVEQWMESEFTESEFWFKDSQGEDYPDDTDYDYEIEEGIIIVDCQETFIVRQDLSTDLSGGAYFSTSDRYGKDPDILTYIVQDYERYCKYVRGDFYFYGFKAEFKWNALPHKTIDITYVGDFESDDEVSGYQYELLREVLDDLLDRVLKSKYTANDVPLIFEYDLAKIMATIKENDRDIPFLD